MIEAEWNFDKVPDSQLVACCYWEYARESVFIRSTLKSYSDWFHTGSKWENGAAKINKNLEKIHSIGHCSEVFVRGCVFQPDRITNANSPKKRKIGIQMPRR